MENKVYFGFALADSMFNGDVEISRRSLDVAEVKSIVDEGVVPCLNKFHAATVDAMQNRFGLDVSIPDSPVKVELGAGDAIVVMGVRGLPRLEDRRHYSQEEIDGAQFAFHIYSVK